MFESKPIKYNRAEYLAGARSGMAKAKAQRGATKAKLYPNKVQGRNGPMSMAPSLTKTSTFGRMSSAPSATKARGLQKPTYKIPRKPSNGIGVGY
jgi:hypothetical protein